MNDRLRRPRSPYTLFAGTVIPRVLLTGINDLPEMPGVDLSGYAGMMGKVDRHLARLFLAVVLGSVIQAGAESGTSHVDPAFADRLWQGAGQGVNEATQQIVRKELQIQPSIEVRRGARIAVFTTKDVNVRPYQNETGSRKSDAPALTEPA